MGFVLTTLGLVLGIVWGIPLVAGLFVSPGAQTLVAAMTGMLWICAVVGAGFVIMHKGRVGLWFVYFLTAVFVYWFSAGAVHYLSTQSRNSVYRVIWNGFLLIVWLSIASYFRNRRTQFTGWWDSAGDSQPEQR